MSSDKYKLRISWYNCLGAQNPQLTSLSNHNCDTYVNQQRHSTVNHMKQIARNARKTMAVCAIPDQKLVKGTKSFPTTALGMGPLLVNYSLQSSAIDVNKVKIRKIASEAWFVVVYSSNCQAHRHTITTCSYRTPPKAHPSP